MRLDARFALVAGVISMLAVARAHAQAPADAVTAQAQEHFQAGQAALANGDGVTAIREFEAAQALRFSPVMDYYLGNAHEQQGQACVAVQYYSRYLASVPTAENRAQAEMRAAELEPSCRPAPLPQAAPAVAPVYGAPAQTASAPQAAAAPLAVAPLKRSRWKVWLGVTIGCTLAIALIAGVAVVATLGSSGGGSPHHDWHLDGAGRSEPVQGLVLFRF